MMISETVAIHRGLREIATVADFALIVHNDGGVDYGIGIAVVPKSLGQEDQAGIELDQVEWRIPFQQQATAKFPCS